MEPLNPKYLMCLRSYRLVHEIPPNGEPDPVGVVSGIGGLPTLDLQDPGLEYDEKVLSSIGNEVLKVVVV